MTDAAHAQLRAAGALIEEVAADEDEDDADGGGVGGKELVLEVDEKMALGSSATPVPAAVDLRVPSPLTLKGKSERAGADAGAIVGSWTSSVTNTSASMQ